MQKRVNGVVRDMTPEEEAEYTRRIEEQLRWEVEHPPAPDSVQENKRAIEELTLIVSDILGGAL